MNINPTPASPARERGLRMDFWRGCAILMIFINHLDFNLLSILTTRAWGLSDAAELLVFLAGVGTARALISKYESGSVMAISYIGRRTVRLYIAHILLFLGIGAICLLYKSVTGSADLALALHYNPLLERPLSAVVEALSLSYLPAYADILPLYIALTIFGGVAALIFRTTWFAMLAVSFAIYMTFHLSGFNLPAGEYERTWFFNPFCWQFLFVTGMVIWICHEDPRFQRIIRSPWMLALSAVIVGVGIHSAAPWTYWGLPSGSGVLAHWLSPHLDKQTLAPLRYIHFLATAHIAYVVVGEANMRTRVGRVVARVGQNALPVFLFSTLLAVAVQAYGRAAGLSGAGHVVMALVGLASIFTFNAIYHTRRTRENHARPSILTAPLR